MNDDILLEIIKYSIFPKFKRLNKHTKNLIEQNQNHLAHFFFKGFKYQTYILYHRDYIKYNFNDALCSASVKGHFEIVKYAVANGANNFNNALWNASYNGYFEIVKYMVANGANNFNDALHNASWHGYSEIVKYLKDLNN